MIIDSLNQKLIDYQKNRDTARLEVLRFLLSKIKNKEIELRPQGMTVDKEVVLKLITKELKNRRDAIDLYARGNKPERVALEQAEAALWEELREFVESYQ